MPLNKKEIEKFNREFNVNLKGDWYIGSSPNPAKILLYLSMMKDIWEIENKDYFKMKICNMIEAEKHYFNLRKLKTYTNLDAFRKGLERAKQIIRGE